MSVKRKKNPSQYKNGGPRLRGMNQNQLAALLDKTQQKKNKAKIQREIKRRFA